MTLINIKFLEIKKQIFYSKWDYSFFTAPFDDDLYTKLLEELEKVFEEMYEKAAEVGGAVSGEHGIGFAKKEYLREQIGEEQIRIMRGIKQVFDPKGLLNPEKVISGE